MNGNQLLREGLATQLPSFRNSHMSSISIECPQRTAFFAAVSVQLPVVSVRLFSRPFAMPLVACWSAFSVLQQKHNYSVRISPSARNICAISKQNYCPRLYVTKTFYVQLPISSFHGPLTTWPQTKRPSKMHEQIIKYHNNQRGCKCRSPTVGKGL